MFAVDRLDRVEADLAGLVDDLGEVQVHQSPRVWQTLDRIEKLGAAAKTLLAPKVDDSGEWRRAGHPDPASYLAAKAGTTPAQAREDLNTGRQAHTQPIVASAMKAGRMSRQQANAVSAAAKANPAAENKLVEKAGTEDLRSLREHCDRERAAADADTEATERRVRANRRCRTGTTGDGGWSIGGYGTRKAGSTIDTALGIIADGLFHRARRTGNHENPEAYRFDALEIMARRALGLPDHDDNQPTGHRPEPEPAPPPPLPSKKHSPGVSHLALLRVDLDALVNGAVGEDQICEIAGCGAIPVQAARDLLGDSVLKLVITRGVDVINVTSLGRGPTAAQRIALLWKHPGCVVQGCNRRLGRQHDHRIPWTENEQTRLDNLDPYCTYHHQQKTRGWKLAPGRGRRPMIPPERRRE